MLSLAEKKKRASSGERSYEEFVPWSFIWDGLVVNKDGSLMAVFQIDGLDYEGVPQAEIDQLANITEMAFAGFDEKFSMWMVSRRRKSTDYPDGTVFSNPIAAYIDSEWKNQITSGNQYINEYYLCIAYSQGKNIDAFYDRINHYMVNEGLKGFRALTQTIKDTFSDQAAKNLNWDEMRRNRMNFDSALISFSQTIASVGTRRLKEEAEILKFLHDAVSPCREGQGIKLPAHKVYLDTFLPDCRMVIHSDVLEFQHVNKRFVGALSIKDWPAGSVPGLLDSLMSLPFDATLSQVFRFQDRDKVKAFIGKMERHNNQLKKPMRAMIREYVTKEESFDVNQVRAELEQDAKDALAEVEGTRRTFGYFNVTYLVYGDTPEEVQSYLGIAAEVLASLEVVTIRETNHLASSWMGSLPGQHSEIVRWYYMSTGTLADLAPMRVLKAGDMHNAYLSNQSGKIEPTLAVLPTELSTPFWFNFHCGDLAHTLVVGPSRNGKSVFMNWLIALFAKYSPCNRYIFDKDHSCYIPTMLQGGTHIDFSSETGAQVKTNPLALIGSDQHIRWVESWIKLLIVSRGYKLTVEDDNEIHVKLTTLRNEFPAESWTLAAFHNLLNSNLRTELSRWVRGGEFGDYFDNSVDNFALTDLTCIEMKGLFFQPALAEAFIEYAFYRIYMTLDGRPTIIYLEECWFLLANPLFAAKILDWLKTLAKKNAFLVLTTQSLDEIAKSEVFASIIDNVPTRIYLPNPSADAHYELYTEKFQLNDEQVDRIKRAVKKRNYYIWRDEMCRMIDAVFPPQILACLRSDSKARAVFKKHFENPNRSESWQFDYIDEMIEG